MPIDDGEAEDSGESTEEEEEAGASSDEAVELLVGATMGAVTDPPEDAEVLPFSSFELLVTILVEVGSTDDSSTEVELGTIPPTRLEIPPMIPPPPFDDEDGEASSVLVEEACARLGVELGSPANTVEVRDGVPLSLVGVLDDGVAESSASEEDEEEGSRELKEEEEEVAPITGTVISLLSADRVDVTG